MARARTTKRKEAWQLQEAKAHLSEVVDRAANEGPQVITRHGKKEAVVVAFETYTRLVAREVPLVDMLLRSPLRGSGLVIERDRDMGRDVELEP